MSSVLSRFGGHAKHEVCQGSICEIVPSLSGQQRSDGDWMQVLSVENGVCIVDYDGPPPIGMGIQAAIKDKFPDIRTVTVTSINSQVPA